jgi:hypothetical protein
MPFRDTHSCLVNEQATEIVGEKKAKTKWGEVTFVMARMGAKTVVRSIKIPGSVPVSTAQQLCTGQNGQFSPATPLNPQKQLLSEEYCFNKLSRDNKREVLRALVRDFEMPCKEVAMGDWDASRENELPDSAFALILPGGQKDGTGNTVPRSMRKLPYKNVRGVIDKAHLQTALSEVNKVGAPSNLKREALLKLLRATKAVGLDIQDNDKFRLSDLAFYLKQLDKVGG